MLRIFNHMLNSESLKSNRVSFCTFQLGVQNCASSVDIPFRDYIGFQRWTILISY